MITTKKELDDTDKKILAMAAEGKTAKNIAYQLNIKQKHIEWRIVQMKKWYNCGSLIELVAKFVTNATD